MNSNHDLELTLELALVTAQLQAIEKSADVLSDLGDIKEQRKLQDQLEKLLAELGQKGLVPDDPIEFTRIHAIGWLKDLGHFVQSGTKLLDEDTPSDYPDPQAGYSSLNSLRKKHELISSHLDHFQETLATLREDCFKGFFGGKKQKQDIGVLWSLLKLLGIEEGPIGDPLQHLEFVMVASDKTNALPSKLEDDLKIRLEEISQHISNAESQDKDITDAIEGISNGEFTKAETLAKIPQNKRYGDLRFQKLEGAIEDRNNILDEIDSAKNASERLLRIYEAFLKLGVEGWPDSSHLKQLMLADRDRTSKAKRARSFRIGVFSVVALIIATGLGYIGIEQSKIHQAEVARQREFAEAEVARGAAELVEMRRLERIQTLENNAKSMQAALSKSNELVTLLEPLLERQKAYYAEARSNIETEINRADRVIDVGNQVIVEFGIPIEKLEKGDPTGYSFYDESEFESLYKYAYPKPSYPNYVENSAGGVFQMRTEIALHGYHRGRIVLKSEPGRPKDDSDWYRITFSILPKELTQYLEPKIKNDLNEHLKARDRLEWLTDAISSVRDEEAEPAIQVWANRNGVSKEDAVELLDSYQADMQKLQAIQKALEQLRG
ncbi:hypothetical protein N9142_04435 [Akkermansiaceae bacterium]|nr:hypothetical protein [bacterium]MDB4434367.1 hypothetical protein [Akkermansiaceae bacterium]